MEKYVVTVGRQFGSLGRPIAKRTAELLGIECYDRDIVEDSAKQLNLPLAVVGEEEEEAKASFGKLSKMMFPLGTGTSQLQDKIFSIQESIILNLADKQSCILVGRCSDFIMRNHDHVMRVHLFAPMGERIKNCVESLSLTEEQARKMCVKVDRARENYHLKYAGYSPSDPEHTDIMMNSSLLGIEGSAQALAALIVRKFSVG